MKEYTFDYIKKFYRPKKYLADEVPTIYDGSISRWVYKETLAEKDERWYLTVDFTDKGDLDYYFLDYESAYVDAHYKFKMTKEDAEKLFGDKDVYLHVLMKEYLNPDLSGQVVKGTIIIDRPKSGIKPHSQFEESVSLEFIRKVAYKIDTGIRKYCEEREYSLSEIVPCLTYLKEVC